MFTAILFIIAKMCIQPKYLAIGVIYPYTEILFSSKDEILIHATTWMNLDIMLG